MITWGLPIWLYLWLAGMAAGAFFAAFLAERIGKHADHRLLHLSLYFGIPAALAGVLFLLADLSYLFRFWHLFVFFNPTSPMSIGSWLLILWTGIGVLILLIWHARKRIPIKLERLLRVLDVFYWAGFIASIILMSYTGVLLAVSNQPLWSSTFFLPPLFVVSAISTGATILILLGLIIPRIRKKYSETIRRMVQVDAIVIMIEIAVLFIFLLLLSRSGIPGAGESMMILLTGVLAVPFWVGVVLLAILLPLILDFIHWGQKIDEHRSTFIITIASSACVIIGGLVLRTVIVIGGQL